MNIFYSYRHLIKSWPQRAQKRYHDKGTLFGNETGEIGKMDIILCGGCIITLIVSEKCKIIGGK